jgi:hypothetical protein
MRRHDQLMARIVNEDDDIVCGRCGGSGIEPAVDPDEAAGDEAYEDLRNAARRHWTTMAMLEAEGLLYVLDDEIVDEEPLAPGGP